MRRGAPGHLGPRRLDAVGFPRANEASVWPWPGKTVQCCASESLEGGCCLRLLCSGCFAGPLELVSVRGSRELEVEGLTAEVGKRQVLALLSPCRLLPRTALYCGSQ